jgi:transcriptional regulator with XRE-family HTH domain
MKIRAIRKTAGISQGELAERCNTSQQQIARIEAGLVDAKVSTLRKVADALQCEVVDLFYTRLEFLECIREMLREENINPGTIRLKELINLGYTKKSISTYHPFWNDLVISEKGVNIARRTK